MPPLDVAGVQRNMDIKTLCLGVLTEGEASGYDIKKYFENVFKYFYVAGFGSIYPALTELMREGAVTCREETQANRPDRKIYTLTPAGRDAFLKSLAATPPRHRIRSEFYVLLHFAHLLPAAHVRCMLDERLVDVNRVLQELQRALDASNSGECPFEPGQLFEVELGMATLTAHRDFIVEKRAALLESIDAGRDTGSDGALAPHRKNS